jgi:hypothetical protein
MLLASPAGCCNATAQVSERADSPIAVASPGRSTSAGASILLHRIKANSGDERRHMSVTSVNSSGCLFAFAYWLSRQNNADLAVCQPPTGKPAG